jgi:predicted Zn-dependent protease with MMP-like domain
VTDRSPTAAQWAALEAPSLEEFEAIARAAFAALPAQFRTLIDEVPIMVADFPEDDVLEEMDTDSPFDLMGLFEGVGLPHGGATPTTGQMPNRIWLYRRPILDYWAENEETLGAVITHVLVHEIGHHFGYSDEDMEALEAAAEAAGD